MYVARNGASSLITRGKYAGWEVMFMSVRIHNTERMNGASFALSDGERRGYLSRRQKRVRSCGKDTGSTCMHKKQ